MIKTIDAIIPPNTETGFSTPDEAIAFSKSIPSDRQKGDALLCVGRLIRRACWSDDSVVLHLDNAKLLRFGCSRNIVDLTVEDDGPNTVAGRPDEVRVRLGDSEIYWKRDEMMRALEGNTIYRIQASQIGFFLYVTNIGILSINVLIDRQTGQRFLFWSPTD